MRLLCCGLLFFAHSTSSLFAGDRKPTEDAVRQSIVRSLPFLEKEGLAWRNKRDCMSCHHVPFMLWSHNEAKAHGVPVDEEKLAEWTEWSMGKSLAARDFFKLNAKVHQTLPEALQMKLRAIVEEGFTTEAEFQAALTKLLTADEMKEHRANLVKQAALPKKGGANDGGGLDTMTQLFLGRDRSVKNADTGAFFASTADLLLRWQENDGHWKAAGQLPSRRWARPAADQTTTLWTILALSGYDDKQPHVSQALERAHAAVKTERTDGNLEWLAARLLYEHRFGAALQTDALRQTLLKRQNADGGWSALPGGASEAFSTGQSIYALRLTNSHAADAIDNGRRFLLQTQTANGSWSVFPGLISTGGADRLKRLEPIYRFWGTAWASIGLSRSLAAQ